MYFQLIKELRHNYERISLLNQQIKDKSSTSNSINLSTSLNSILDSELDYADSNNKRQQVGRRKYKSMLGSFCTESSLLLDETSTGDSTINADYETKQRVIETSQAEYINFKDALKENEAELANLIEEKINHINDLKTDLLKEKLKDEMNIRVSSIKYVMEQMNAASLTITKEEYERQIEKLRDEDTSKLNDLKASYEYRIDDLYRQIDSYKGELEQQKNAYRSDLDLTMQSIDNDLSTYCDINLNTEHLFSESSSSMNNNISNIVAGPSTPSAQLKKLLAEVEEKNAIIKSLKSKEDMYLNEMSTLKKMLNDVINESANYHKNNNSCNKINDSVVFEANTEVKKEEPTDLMVNSNQEDLINLDTSSSSTLSNKSSDTDEEDEANSSTHSSSSPSSSASNSSSSSTTRIKNNNEEPDRDANDPEIVQNNSLNNSRTSEETTTLSHHANMDSLSQDYANSLKKVLDEKDAIIQKLNVELLKFKETEEEYMSYKMKYIELKESIDTLTHPCIVELQNELQLNFDQKNEEIKSNYEAKLKEEIENYKLSQEEKIQQIIEENNRHIAESDRKQKIELQKMSKEFEEVMNDNLKKLESELAPYIKNQDMEIKFRYVSEHRRKEITDDMLDELSLNDTTNLNESTSSTLNNNSKLDSPATVSHKVYITPLNELSEAILNNPTSTSSKHNLADLEEGKQASKANSVHDQSTSETITEIDDDSLIEQMPLIKLQSDYKQVLNESINDGLNNEDNETGYDKVIEIEAKTLTKSRKSNGFDSNNDDEDYDVERKITIKKASSENIFKALMIENFIDEPLEAEKLEHIENPDSEMYVKELEDKIKQLEQTNKHLQETLESLYEKDDVFMASTRRENEEKENFIKLLQLDIENLTNDKCILQNNYQNLAGLLSKAHLMSVSIDEHVNKRLNRLMPMHHGHTGSNGPSSRVGSPKNSAHLSSGESGVAENDPDSNDELSDESLDISQRILLDHIINQDFPSDEAISETNVKIQTKIDRLFSIIDDQHKQLIEANSMQAQLAQRVEDNQKMYNELKCKSQEMEFEYEEKLNDLLKKVTNYESLVETYQSDLQNSMTKIAQLEQGLDEKAVELTEAMSLIENEKNEVSNLETVRKDLEAQRSLFTKELQDTDIKELIENNTILLEQKHELEYKLNKTNELSEQQIKDLEETVESYNKEICSIKDKYETQVNELKKEMDAMESQIKADKSFIETQMAEREQEREEYEAKIEELKQLVTKKTSHYLGIEDTYAKKMKEFDVAVQEKSDHINQLTLAKEDLERKLDESDKSQEKLQDQIRSLEEKLSSSVQLQEELEKTIEQYKADMSELMKNSKTHAEQVDQLRDQIKELDEKLHEQLVLSERLAIERDDSIQQMTDLKSELLTSMNRFSELQIHKENLEMELRSQIKFLEEKCRSAATEIDEKEVEIAALGDRIRDLNEDLQSRLESEINHRKYFGDGKDEEELMESYKQQIEDLTKENENLKAQVDDLSESAKELEQEKNEISSMSQNLLELKNTELNELNNQLDQSKIKLQELETKIAENEIEKQSLESKMQQLDEQLAQLKETSDSSLNALSESFKIKIQSLTDQIDTLDAENIKLGEENQSLKTEIHEANQLNAELKGQIQASSSKHGQEIEVLRADVLTAQENLRIKEETIASLNQDIEQIRVQLDLIEIDYKQSKEECVRLDHLNKQMSLSESEMKQTLEELHVEKREKDNLLDQLNQEYEKLKESNNSLKYELDDKLEQLNELNKQFVVESEKRVQLDSKLAECQKLVDYHRDECKELSQKCSEFEVKVSVTQKLLQARNEEYELIGKRLLDSELKCKELEQCQTQFVEYEKLLNETKEKVNALERENNELRAQVDRVTASKDAQTEQLIAELEIIGKDYTEKLAELNSDHALEMDKLRAQGREMSEKERLDHQRELELLQAQHQEDLNQLKQSYERQIKELKDTVDRLIESGTSGHESADERSVSNEILSVSNENCQKLRDQIKLTKELDKDLIEKLNQREVELKQKQLESQQVMPNEIKDILEKIDNEGVMLLSLSEMLKLKAHLTCNKPEHKEIELATILKNTAQQNEKNQLIDEVFKMKDLLAQINSKSDSNDWRNDIYKTISNIFNNQKDYMLAELRSFVVNQAHLDQLKQISHLESKIDDLNQIHKKSLEYLSSSDRTSLLDELKQVKEEVNKMLNEIGRYQEIERQLRHEINSLQYARETDAIKAKDLKESLNQEKTKSLDLMDRLNLETKKTFSMQEQLAGLTDEIAKMKELLDSETKKFQSICKELDSERTKTQQQEAKARQMSQTNDENEFKKYYLKNNNSADIFTSLNGSSNKNRVNHGHLEQQIVELEKHNSQLEAHLMQERAKYEKLLKIYNETKNNQLKNGNIEAFNSANHNLERIRQALEYIAIKQKDDLESNTSHRPNNHNSIKLSLNDIIKDLEICQLNTSIQMSNNLMDSTELEAKLIQQNKELLSTVKKYANDKSELRNVIVKLEEELWTAKNRKVEPHGLTDHEREKFKKLYQKYLRSESFRKSLIYQKKFLLIMLSGYEETEREILSTLRIENSSYKKNAANNQYYSSMSSLFSSSPTNSVLLHHNNYLLSQQGGHKQGPGGQIALNQQHLLPTANFGFTSRFVTHKAKSRFRKAVICVIAIRRIKFLQRKHSLMLTRVDSHRNT